MGRGLDGYLLLTPLRPCAVFKLHRALRLAKFRWRIASGKHLFPFRTEQLSHSAPMVLGGQPPGRVGRRRFFVAWPALSSGAGHYAFRASSRLSGSGAALAEEAGFLDQAAVRAAGLGPGGRKGRRGARSGKICATQASSPSGLQPVLAQGCEVDQKVGGVRQPVGELGLWIEHEFVRYGGLRTLSGFCNTGCRRRLKRALESQRGGNPANSRTSLAVSAGRSTLGEWPAPAIRWVWAPGSPLAYWRSARWGSSTICSSAPIRTISGLPAACIPWSSDSWLRKSRLPLGELS